MTEQEALDAFGKMVVEGGRNKTIQQIRSLLVPDRESASSRSLQDMVPSHSPETHEEFMRFAAYVVDTTLALVLGAFEDAGRDGLDMQLRDPEGKLHSLDEISDGFLSAQLFGREGWIVQFGDSYTADVIAESVY